MTRYRTWLNDENGGRDELEIRASDDTFVDFEVTEDREIEIFMADGGNYVTRNSMSIMLDSEDASELYTLLRRYFGDE